MPFSQLKSFLKILIGVQYEPKRGAKSTAFSAFRGKATPFTQFVLFRMYGQLFPETKGRENMSSLHRKSAN